MLKYLHRFLSRFYHNKTHESLQCEADDPYIGKILTQRKVDIFLQKKDKTN